MSVLVFPSSLTLPRPHPHTFFPSQCLHTLSLSLYDTQVFTAPHYRSILRLTLMDANTDKKVATASVSLYSMQLRYVTVLPCTVWFGMIRCSLCDSIYYAAWLNRVYLPAKFSYLRLYVSFVTQLSISRDVCNVAVCSRLLDKSLSLPYIYPQHAPQRYWII